MDHFQRPSATKEVSDLVDAELRSGLLLVQCNGDPPDRPATPIKLNSATKLADWTDLLTEEMFPKDGTQCSELALVLIICFGRTAPETLQTERRM